MSGETKKILTLNVRDLVEFAARRGDLFFESSGGPTWFEGAAGHRQLQKSRGANWQAEYALKYQFDIGHYRVTLQGRADLVDSHNAVPVIEEIKTTYVSPERVAEDKQALYWAQAKTYAYLHAMENPAERQRYEIRVSLFNLLDKSVHTETQVFDVDHLKDFVYSMLEIYLRWFCQVVEHRQHVAKAARALEFPHQTYRPGQHALARQIYRTIRDKQALLAEAPTGTGKTISTLFPAIKALGENLVEQIVYLTAKTSAQANAEQTLLSLRQRGLPVDFLTLTARDKICPCRANPAGAIDLITADGRCCRTVGFYDRLPQARVDCLKAQALSGAVIEEIAEQYQLCPFALGLHLLPWITAVICDVNYFFDPLVKLSAFENHADMRTLLIDEAHNLPDRSREMYSAAISSSQLKDIRENPGRRHGNVKRAANRLLRKIATVVTTDQIQLELPSGLIEAVGELIEALATIDESDTETDLFEAAGDKHKENLRALFRFYTIGLLYADAHRCLMRVAGKEKTIVLFCLDAARYLHENYKNARAVTGFSATLKPLAFYRHLLGFAENSAMVKLPPAFSPENLLVVRCDYIDTRWQARDDSAMDLLALIAAVYFSKPGKYLVFFPSYDYLNRIYLLFGQRHATVPTVRQETGNGLQERAMFLDRFFNSQEPTLGFAILGGVFAEGVDYLADALHGAIIIGTGMPQPSPEQQLMQDYFSGLGMNGFQYAYQFPGFTRVQQTAGRVIRSESDRGIVVLVDPRFLRADYRRLMPNEWRVRGCKSVDEIKIQLDEFWSTSTHLS